MSDQPENLLRVLMTPEAAGRFREALRFAAVRIEPENNPGPQTADQLKAFEYTQWLLWGVSRVESAQDSARKGTAPE